MERNVITLSAELVDWKGIDEAAHLLAMCMGLVPDGTHIFDYKWVYWNNNPLGTMLVNILDQLVRIGVLEKRDEPDIQYRWSSNYSLPRKP